MITRYFINSHGVYKVANLVVYMITRYFIHSYNMKLVYKATWQFI